MPRQCRYVILLLVVHYFSGCLAQKNITIDDSDLSITYSGIDWEVSAPSQLDVNGTHHLSTNDSNANARFTFTGVLVETADARWLTYKPEGVAVYFMSPLWPYLVGTQVQLDNQQAVTLNLTDPNINVIPPPNGEETVRSAVVWSSGPIPNTTHTLIMTRSPTIPFVIVDAIIYTVLDPPPINSSSSPATGSPSSPPSITGGAALSTSTSSSDSSSSSSHVLPIVLGTVLGALGLLIIGVAAWLCSRGKKRPESEAWTIAGASLHKSTPPPKGPLPLQQSTASQTHGHQQQPPGVDRVSTNDSWSSPDLQMSEIEVPLMAHPLPNPHDTSCNGHSQDFNPWTGLSDSVPQQQAPYPQQPMPYGQQAPYPSHIPFYAVTTLSTITEKSTPAGTMNSGRLPLGSSPASHPSVELGYYSPRSETAGSGARLSYASDLPAGAAAAANPHQYPQPSPNSAAGSATAGVGGAQPRKLKAEKNSSLVAVNRTDDEQDDLKPPAYGL